MVCISEPGRGSRVSSKPVAVACSTLLLLLFAAGTSQTHQPAGATVGSAVIWRDPGSVETRDRFWGNGHETRSGPIPIEHAKWFAELAGQLRLEQVRVAFETAAALPQEAEAFVRRVIEKIDELRNAVQSTAF